MAFRYKIVLLIGILLFAEKVVNSQNHAFIDLRESRSDFNVQQKINFSKEEILKFANNYSNKNEFLIVDEVSSPYSKHFRLNQVFNGTKIYRAELKINTDLQGNVLSLFDNTFASEPSNFVFPKPSEWIAIKELAEKNGIDKIIVENVFFPIDETLLIPAVRIEIADKANNFDETIVASGGKVLYSRSLNLSFKEAVIETDTPAIGNVFMPDPLSSSANVYGGPWVDDTNHNTPELFSQLVSKTIDVSFENDSFKLKNDFVIIKDIGAPFFPVAVSTQANFNFNRSQSEFEDVNVFYHLSTFNNYIRNTLGFTNICNYQIIADPHALNGADNSNFNAALSPPRLQFGDGGVDDAEDADVIIHEYGHAISHSAAPNTNNGLQRMAIDEGIGDYFASSYSRFIKPLFWENVYTWDGHNEFWAGRFTNSSDHYPENIVNNKYNDADIWSSVLMEIWGDIGRETADILLIQANHSFASNMTMPQAAMLYLQADQLLFDWSHFQPIRDRMVARGLLPANVSVPTINTSEYKLLNTSDFAMSTGNAFIYSSEYQNTVASVYDISGRHLFEIPFKGNLLELKQSDFSSGIFLIKVRNKIWKIAH